MKTTGEKQWLEKLEKSIEKNEPLVIATEMTVNSPNTKSALKTEHHCSCYKNVKAYKGTLRTNMFCWLLH